jgi:hypothetical protein
VIIAAIVGGCLMMGLLPISSDDDGSLGAIALSLGIVIGFALVVALKGKLWAALGSMFIPLLGLVSAVRLGRPRSPWARRFYAEGSEKLEKAKAREIRVNRRWKRLQDLIGGAPSEPGAKR